MSGATKMNTTTFSMFLGIFFVSLFHATSSSSAGLCEERKNNLNIADSSALVCKENGEFMAMQRNAFNFYCVSTLTGEIIPNTIVEQGSRTKFISENNCQKYSDLWNKFFKWRPDQTTTTTDSTTDVNEEESQSKVNELLWSSYLDANAAELLRSTNVVTEKEVKENSSYEEEEYEDNGKEEEQEKNGEKKEEYENHSYEEEEHENSWEEEEEYENSSYEKEEYENRSYEEEEEYENSGEEEREYENSGEEESHYETNKPASFEPENVENEIVPDESSDEYAEYFFQKYLTVKELGPDHETALY